MRRKVGDLACIALLGMAVGGPAQEEREAVTRYVTQGPEHVTDGWVSHRGASFTDAELRNHGVAWEEYHRVLIRFDLGAVDPARFGRVGKAILRLTVTEAENSAQKVTTLAPSTQPWTDQATLETADGKTPWPQQKGYGNIDYAMRMESLSSQVIEAAGVVEFDVTDVVDRWLYQGLANQGFILRTGDTIWGRPDAGTWKQTFAASEAGEGGPALVVDLVGEPPTPDTIPQRTRRWYPSALLPPVREPYLFMWYFGEPPRYPGAVANAGSWPREAVPRGLPLGWFYGPQNPWLKDEQGFLDSYVNAAREAERGGSLGIMVDEWQSPGEGEPSLNPANPYGITGSIKGMLEARKVNPRFFMVVAWRGEDNIEAAARQGLPDLLAIEAYSHEAKQFPREWGTCGDLTGTKRRIDVARKLGLIEQTIPWLGMILAPQDYHEGDRLTPEMIDQQITELRAYAPEMPGVAFYGNGDPELAEACDRVARKRFVDPAPEVLLVEPAFEAHLTTPHVTLRAEAKAQEDRQVVRYRWFIDNRLVAETEQPQYVWDLRGERSGSHFVTVHAVDNAFHRAAAQILVNVQR